MAPSGHQLPFYLKAKKGDHIKLTFKSLLPYSAKKGEEWWELIHILIFFPTDEQTCKGYGFSHEN